MRGLFPGLNARRHGLPLASLLSCSVIAISLIQSAVAQTINPAPGQPYCGQGSCNVDMAFAFHGVNTRVELRCGVETFNPDSPVAQNTNINVSVSPSSAPRFLSDTYIKAFLDAVRARTRSECYKTVQEMWLRPGIDRGFLSQYDIAAYTVSIGYGYAPTGTMLVRASLNANGSGHYENLGKQALVQQQSQARQRQALLDEQRTIRNASLQLQRTFATRTGAHVWVTTRKLAANPFIYNNIIVGTVTRFLNMASQNSAFFAYGSGTTIFVDGVPPTQFTGGEMVVLAIRVNGVKSLSNGSAPYGHYVGSYICREANCTDFFNENLSW